ncbi:MAG: hypothetical protein WKF81_07515 [Thermomicrobiales bacterium]
MSKRLLTLVALLVASLGTLVTFGGSPVAAQDEAAPYDLSVMTRQCEEAPCTDDTATPIGDVTVFVTSEDGTIDYGSCTTSIEGEPDGCSVPVDAGTTVAVSVDDSTVPEGYGPEENPVIYEVPAERTDVGDVFLSFSPLAEEVPDEEVPEEDVPADDTGDAIEEDTGDGSTPAELPATGSGNASVFGGSSVSMALGFGSASLLILAFVTIVATRRSSTSKS